tara:strand:- start:763 stop:1209 length:447 start_codon:yes stop_codon:yes gene_type:complete
MDPNDIPPFRALLDAFPGHIEEAEKALNINVLALLRIRADNLAQIAFDLDCTIDAPSTCGIPSSQLQSYYEELYALREGLSRSILNVAYTLRCAPHHITSTQWTPDAGRTRPTLAECRAIAETVSIADASRDLLTLVEFVMACTPEED